MFHTEKQMPQFDDGNVRWRGEAAWPGEVEAPYQGEEEYPGAYGQGEEEYPYGQGEEEYPYGQGEEEYPYGQGEEEYPFGQGEEEYPGAYGQGEEEYPYGQGEEEYPGAAYGQGEEEYPYGQGEEEYPGAYEQGEEERFLPALGALIPIAGQLLGGLLGGGRREIASEAAGYGQGENSYEGEAGEAGEAEEQFLHRVLTNVLGNEAEADEAILSPTQESQFASQLMEASDEQELGRILSGIINSVGGAVQGVRGAVNSPQGRALIEAVAPVAQAVLAGEGSASLVAGEAGELDHEQDQFEVARRVVQLASAAARDVAMAPPDAPPQLVGELSIFRAARHFARPLFNQGLRTISPLARRYWGRRYYGFRRGYGYGYRGPSGRRYWGYGYGPRRRWRRYGSYGYPPYYGGPVAAPGPPEPEPGPEPMPPPPRPGFRWVMVPIGAPPPPPPEPPPPPPPPGPEPAAGAPPPEPSAAPQTEFGWRRRGYRGYRGSGGYRGYRGYRGWRGYGGYGRYGGYSEDDDDDQEFGWRRRGWRRSRGYGGSGEGDDAGSPSGRWIRRRGRIILLGV
jgi:hypothetical protein